MNEELLTVLGSHANVRGLVLVAESALREESGLTRENLAAYVRELESDGCIEVLAPLPFLVLRLHSWSGRRSKTSDSSLSAYSSKLLHKQHVNSSYRQPGAHRPIDQALLIEILETLGEADGKSFEKALELYSSHVIRKALDRVRRAKDIRKNRTALFRHLLPRLARQERTSE